MPSRRRTAWLSSPALDVLDEDFGVADDGGERGAQFVAHVGEEVALGVAGGDGGGALAVGLDLRGGEELGLLEDEGEEVDEARRAVPGRDDEGVVDVLRRAARGRG